MIVLEIITRELWAGLPLVLLYDFDGREWGKSTWEGSTMEMKKVLRETQTLHGGCSKAEPKFFALPQTPSWGRRTAKI